MLSVKDKEQPLPMSPLTLECTNITSLDVGIMFHTFRM
jgi:hypothetical protein